MRRRITFGVGVLALSVAAGCGGGSSAPAASGKGDALRVIQAAAATTAQQNSMQVRGTVSSDLDATTGQSTAPVTANVAGVFQVKPLLARMTMSGLSVGGHPVGDVTMLMTRSALFMRMPMLAAQTGKPWVGIRFSEMKAMSGFDFKQLMSQAQQMQPSQYVAQLTASGDVHVVGQETVNGVQTTHYAGTVSLADEMSHYGPALRAQLEPVMKRAGFTGSKLDIWLDGKGLVRRVRTTAQGGHGSFTFSMDVVRYGVPVNVAPPPSSQVADLAHLTQPGSTQ